MHSSSLRLGEVMSRFLIFGFVVFFIHCELAYSSEYNLYQHIKLSLENDPEYAQVINEGKKVKYLVDQGLPSRQLILSLSNENGYSSDSDQNTNLVSGELSKEVIETGTAFSLSHTKTIRPDRQENVTQVRLEQSLYKNMFGRDVRLKKESLLDEEKLKILEVKELEESYFVKILKSYLELSKAYKEYMLSKQIYNESIKLKDNVKAKYKSKIASLTDLNRSKLLVLLRREEISKKKITFDSLKKQIEKMINSEITSFNADGVSQLTVKLQKLVKNFDGSNWSSTRTSQISKLRESISAKESKLLERANSPELNLLIGYNKDDSTRFATAIKRDETVVGLQLEIPFGDTKSKASYHISKVDLIKSRLDNQRNAIEFEKSTEVILNQLKQVKDQLDIDTEKVELTKLIIKEEEKRFATGRIELEDYIQLKSDYATYRVNQEQSKLNFSQALVDCAALNDSLDIKEIISSL